VKCEAYFTGARETRETMKITAVEFIKSAVTASHYAEEPFPDVAFAGRSNVGKSSLINALTGRRRLARTSSTPGRTQHINFFLVNRSFYFVDLPGYGFAKAPLSVRRTWGPMVEEYLRKRANLKAVVMIFDVRRDPSPEDMTLKNWLDHYGIPAILVVTKIDKLSKSAGVLRCQKIGASLQVAPEVPLLLFSAKTGQGKEAVWNAISSAVRGDNGVTDGW